MYCQLYFFFFKQKTAYEMRISDWSSDVCSSDLLYLQPAAAPLLAEMREVGAAAREDAMRGLSPEQREQLIEMLLLIKNNLAERDGREERDERQENVRSEERRAGKAGVSTFKARG